MAIQMTPEEIQAIFDEYNQALANGIPITREMNDRLRDASKGVKDYSANLRASLNALGTATKQLGKDMIDGKKGASVFNDSLDKAADAASNFAAGFGPVGIAIGLFIKAISFFVGQANKQSDKLYESFQSISRTGAIGAQGMEQVFDSMKKMGYTIDELGNMGEILKQSSANFGLFSSSVLSGTKQFADVAGTIQNSDLRAKLFNMGLSVDDINKGIAGYMNQQGRLGKLQNMTQDEVRKGAVAYIKEMETLTRLTGQQREELEAQRQQAMAVDAFYAAIEDMPDAAREQAFATYNMLAKQNPKLAKEYAANMAGIITGETDLFLATGGKSMEIFSKDFYLNGGKAVDAMDSVGRALAENRDTIKSGAQVGSEFGISLLDADQIIRKKYIKGMNEAAGSVEAQMNETTGATAAQSKLRDEQIKTAQAMQSFINLGVTPATTELAKLAKAASDLTSILPGGTPKTGYGQGGTGTLGKSLASTGAGAAAGAAIGSVVPGVGTAVGAVVGGVAGFMGYELAGGGALKGKPTTGLDEDFLKKLQAAANEYQQMTGKPIELVSAKRTEQEQAKLYEDYKSGKSKFPAAPPGQSRHESGRAVDVPLSTADELDRLGLLQKHGLSRPVPNDPIHIQGHAGYKGSVSGPMAKSMPDVQGYAGYKGSVSDSMPDIFAKNFKGFLSGPMSGYMPNVLMHGNEELSIKPMGGTSNDSAGASEGSISKLIERVDDLIQVSRSQLYVNEKILKYQQ